MITEKESSSKVLAELKCDHFQMFTYIASINKRKTTFKQKFLVTNVILKHFAVHDMTSNTLFFHPRLTW